MEYPTTCRFFFVAMDRVDESIPVIARRLAELFPTRDHGRPITIGVREQAVSDKPIPVEPFPLNKFLGRVKEEMGPKPVTVFDIARWAQGTYPLLKAGTVWNILSRGPIQVQSQAILVFVSRSLFQELSEVLGKKPPDTHCPVAEVRCSYPSGDLNIQEVIYAPPAKT